MGLNPIHFKEIVQYLKCSDFIELICVNKKLNEIIHSLKQLPYLPRVFIYKLLLNYSKDVIPIISLDFKNSFIPPKLVHILYRQNTTTALIPPLMSIRHFIISLNIPIHPKYLIDLNTFPQLTKLTLNIFYEPQQLPSLVLKYFYIHLNSENHISFLSKLTDIKADITYIHIHSLSASSLKRIQIFFPQATIVSSKMSDISLLNKVKCVHNYVPINGTTYECTSVPASIAFLNGNFITSRLIETAYIYGNLLSQPIAPLTFKELFIVNLTLPKRGSILLRGVEKLIVGSCSNLVGFEGLEKCPLKSFTFCKISSLTSLKMPTTLTYLDASDWKPLTIPPLPLLKKLKIKQCQTFRHINIPPNVDDLVIEDCCKLKRITNFSDVQITSLELIELPELSLTPPPTCLKNLVINNIPIFQLDLKLFKSLETARIGACSDLGSIIFNDEIKSFEINNCNDIKSLTHTNLTQKVSISMCTSLSLLDICANEIHLSQLQQLEIVKLKECKDIEIVSCNTIPIFENIIYNSVVLKKITLEDELPKSKKLVLDNIIYSQNSFDFTNQQCTILKVKNLKKIKSIKLPNELKTLSLLCLGVDSISLPMSLCNLHINNCVIKLLNVPFQCTKIKLQKCINLKEISLPSTLTYLKMKKCPIGLLSSSYLPNIPYEILKTYCVSTIN